MFLKLQKKKTKEKKHEKQRLRWPLRSTKPPPGVRHIVNTHDFEYFVAAVVCHDLLEENKGLFFT